MLTDFPVALLSATVLWDILAMVTGAPRWWELAYWTLLLGVIALVPAAVTGFLDFLGLGAEDPAGGVAVRHMAVVLVAGTLFTASLLVRSASPPEEITLAPAHLLAAAGLVALVVGGRLGGALVFRFGVGGPTARDEDGVV